MAKIDARTFIGKLDELFRKLPDAKMYPFDKPTAKSLTEEWFALKNQLEKFLAENNRGVPEVITELNGLFERYYNRGNVPNSKLIIPIEEKLGTKLRVFLVNFK